MKDRDAHILIIRLSAMGDVAMSIPVIRELLRQNPDIKVTVVSKPFLKPLFNNINNLTFFPAQVKGKHKGLLGLYRLYRELKTLNINYIADLHNVLRSKIINFFFSFDDVSIAQIDKGRAEKKSLTRRKNKNFKLLKSTHQCYADVFEKLSFPVDLSNTKPIKKPELLPEVLKFSNLKMQNWIGIAPFAAFESKVYPLELIEQVIDRLSKENYRLFLFGSQREMPILKSIEKKYENTICVAGKLGGLTQELNLISNLDLMLSMDSANAHLSAMQGVKTVTIWGATHPYAGFAPFNQPLDFCILPDRKKYPELPCSVYGNKVYKGCENAMKSIPAKEIVNKIKQVINI